MLKKCKYIPVLETQRLILRELTENDVEDLRKWLGCDELYTYTRALSLFFQFTTSPH